MEPSDSEKKLITISKKLDDALEKRDQAAVESLFADDTTIHADGLALGEDLHGKSEAANWFKSYFDRYDFQHESIAGAVSDRCSDYSGMSFSFWQDKNVTPKPDKFPEGLPDDAKKPATTVGIWHPCYDSNDKIKDLWFLRQLSPDEVVRKLKKPPPQQMLFDPESFKGASGVEQSEERRKQIDEAAHTYSKIWETADETLADKCLAPDVQQYQPVLGHAFKGVDEFKDLIANHYKKNWEPKSQHTHIATTAGSKAFIYWLSKGKERQSGREDELYGLDLLDVNKEGKVQRVVSFRQLTTNEEREYVKEQYQRPNVKA